MEQEMGNRGRGGEGMPDKVCLTRTYLFLAPLPASTFPPFILFLLHAPHLHKLLK